MGCFMFDEPSFPDTLVKLPCQGIHASGIAGCLGLLNLLQELLPLPFEPVMFDPADAIIIHLLPITAYLLFGNKSRQHLLDIEILKTTDQASGIDFAALLK